MFGRTAVRLSRKFTILVSIMFAGLSVFAMNGRTTYQAKISKPNGYPLESPSVNFRFTVLDTVGACILYVEDYAAINMQDTGGLVSFALGNGTRSFPSSGTSMTFSHIFDNSVTSFPCQNAGVYLPGPTDTRKIVMQFNEGAGWQTLPAMAINSVPYAMYANESNNSKTLNGKADTAFVENSTLAALNCQPNEALRFNGASFSCVNVSVSATAVVAALGYAPVQGVSATAPLISSGGSAPTLSITQATSSTDGYLSTVDWNVFNNKLNASQAAIIAALGYTPADNAVSGTFLSKSNNLSDLVSVATARTNLGLGSFATASSLDLGSASATGIIADARLANQSGVTSGTQYTKVTVDGKGRVTNGSNLSSSDVTTALGFTPADNAASGTYLVKSSNLSDLTNVATARTNLGLGSFATASSLDLGSASATGTIADARLANQSAITSGTQYTKVTVDGKGRVTNGANLSSGDVTSALGYTPAQASSATQWTTSGTTINYSAGNVGIGTSNPSSLLYLKSNSSGMNGIISLEADGGGVTNLYSARSALTHANKGVLENSNGMLINPAGGNVGIGVTSANGVLHINTPDATPNILLSRSAMGTQWAIRNSNNGVSDTLIIADNANNSRGIAVEATGNVGIGNTAPTEKLEVAGKLKLTNGFSATNGAVVYNNTTDYLYLGSQSGSSNDGAGISIAGSANTQTSAASGGITFVVTGVSPAMVIKGTTGNVGIGTGTPAAKLDVQGQVKTSMGTPLVNPAGNAVDFMTGNTQYVTFSSCPGNALTVNLYSMFEGSSYSIVVVAPNGCVVDFTGTTNANGGSGGTAVTAFKYPAGQKFSSTGNPMVYSFLRANNFVFVAQVVDFQ